MFSHQPENTHRLSRETTSRTENEILLASIQSHIAKMEKDSLGNAVKAIEDKVPEITVAEQPVLNDHV